MIYSTSPSVRKIIFLFGCLCAFPVSAHHILGRPSYNLNEDSNTPPGAYVETQIGDYTVSYMVYPAFPKASERNRINFYARHSDTNRSYNGQVVFKQKRDSWLTEDEKILGTQLQDDHVYHQDFMIKDDGKYIISAEFTENGQAYVVDFPLQVGAPSSFKSSITVAVVVLGLIVLTMTMIKQKKLQKVQSKRYRMQSDKSI